MLVENIGHVHSVHRIQIVDMGCVLLPQQPLVPLMFWVGTIDFVGLVKVFALFE